MFRFVCISWRTTRFPQRHFYTCLSGFFVGVGVEFVSSWFLCYNFLTAKLFSCYYPNFEQYLLTHTCWENLEVFEQWKVTSLGPFCKTLLQFLVILSIKVN